MTTKEMTDRELLEALYSRLDKVDQRLADGDIEIGMCMHSIRTLCELAGAQEAASHLAAYLKEKMERIRANGGHQEELPTDPNAA